EFVHCFVPKLGELLWFHLLVSNETALNEGYIIVPSTTKDSDHLRSQNFKSPTLPKTGRMGHPKFNREAWATRVSGAESSNRSGSFTWAGKQEKLRSMQLCFFLTSTLIGLIRNWRIGCAITTDLQNECLNEVFDPATQRTLANFQPVPELRHRGGEFKRNITTRRLRRNGYDDTLLRLIVSLVHYHYSLAGLDTTRHQDQSASSIDGDCKGLLVKRIAT